MGQGFFSGRSEPVSGEEEGGGGEVDMGKGYFLLVEREGKRCCTHNASLGFGNVRERGDQPDFLVGHRSFPALLDNDAILAPSKMGGAGLSSLFYPPGLCHPPSMDCGRGYFHNGETFFSGHCRT